ncbi:MAG: GAF domain-containing protein [Gemmatimonadaceae bacterium]|nr:GAF domain-containing protein [Gemmatimonadaceae bacterium]
MIDPPTERPVRAPSTRTRIGAALGAPIAALAASLIVLGKPGTPFLFFYPAVAVAAWYGGVASGVVAALLSVVFADYYFFPPYRSFGVPTGNDALVITVFLTSALIISRVSGVHRGTQAKADLLARQLTARAEELQGELEAGQRLTEELEATNEELAATNEQLEAANEYEAQRGHLFTLAASLARAVTPNDVAGIVFREGLAAAGADGGSVGVVVDDPAGERHVTMLHSAGYGEETMAAFQQFPLVPGRPVSDAIISGAPVLIGSLREWEARYPSTYPAVATLGYESFAAVPVMIAGKAVAAISFSFRGPRAFNAGTVAFLETLASVSGQALERARAFDAEHRAHERTSLIVESVTDGFVALDRDMRYTYVNRRAAEMWNRSTDELLGRTPAEVFADVEGIERSPSVVALARVLADRTPAAVEHFSVALRRWIELRAYPSGEGGVVAFFQDITARRRAQDASSFLADASQLLGSSTDYRETLTNLAHAAVPRLGDWCAVDVLRDPGSTQWPPALDRVAVVHQDPAKIALGAELTAAYPTDWTQQGGFPGVIRTGTPFYIPEVTDAMLMAGARDARHLELLRALQFRSIMVVPLTARDRVLGAMTLCMTESGRTYDEADLALAQDLARRAGAAVDAARLLRDAELANAAKTEFLRTISHELRQPINATISFLELWELGVRGPLDDQLRDDLARMQRNQRHLQRLIEDLLSFTRLDAGQLTIGRQAVPMREVLTSLESIMAPQMEAAGLTFEIAACSPDLELVGDQGRVVQIGVNLLTNALRATAAGGRVRIECARDGDATVIVVSDTGIGIPADRLDHIFSPFTQLGRALNAPKEGAGLGLAISRGLAEVMGGSLTATSAVGIGSTFVLRLPAAEQAVTRR